MEMGVADAKVGRFEPVQGLSDGAKGTSRRDPLMYRDRRLAEGHPALADEHLDTYIGILDQQPDNTRRIDRLLTCLDRVVDLGPPKDILVIGCGPRPQLMKVVGERGHRVTGVEPVPSFVAAANEYLGGSSLALPGCAEALPVPDASQHVILCESVLEHVDSPRAALDEMYRALQPGGIAFIVTTNRHRLHLRGHNGEFRVRFFNWFPSLVRESYVFRHLHHDPSLANHALRPGVHWFNFVDLCKLGRDSGFAQFYSLLDLLDQQDERMRGTWWKRVLLDWIQSNPWLRALALTQVGESVVMLKRAKP